MRTVAGHDGDLEPLRLLASALAGRSVEVAATAPGDCAWTDGTTIFVEPEADRGEQLAMLTVQACLLAGGSLAPDVVDQLRRHRGLTARYLAVEAHRALAAHEAVLPPTLSRLIDHEVAATASSPLEALACARRGEGAGDLPRAFGRIDPRRMRVEEPSPTEADTARTATVPASDTELPVLDEAADPDETDLGNLVSSPVGGGGPIGRLLQRLLRPGRHRGDAGDPGAGAATHAARPGVRVGGRTLAQRGALAAAHGDPPEASATSYPEWDVHARRYRPDWCTVVESRAPAAPGTTSMADTLALRRALSRLGMGLTPCRRRRQGDDIDVDAAVEALVDAAAGVPHEDDAYIESLRRRRDLAALVLLDVSGSAGEAGTGGRTVHEHQRGVAAALTATLHRLGDRVALQAFNSRGRTAVQVLRIKDFDEHLDAAVGQRLDALVPGGYTRLGAAIRHGTSCLVEHGGTPRRLLVVLSDGFAYDHGYQGRYGEADARRALTEARRQGVGCLCISVGSATDVTALRRVFGSAAHAAVPRGDQLPTVIGPLLSSALRSAEAQRRRFQRTERTRERLEIERRAHV